MSLSKYWSHQSSTSVVHSVHASVTVTEAPTSVVGTETTEDAGTEVGLFFFKVWGQQIQDDGGADGA